MNKYIKPGISFQSLTLSSSVSTSCAEHATSSQYQCKQPIPGFEEYETVFTHEMDCYYDQSEMDRFVCYHAPTMATNIFNS